MLNKLFSIVIFRNHIVFTIFGIKISFKMFNNDDYVIKEENLCANYNYNKILESKIKKQIKKNKKCRVAFYIFEIAKWKTDSLYQLLKKDSRYEPFIVIGMTPGRTKTYSKKEIELRFENQINYFKAKGMEVVIGYDIDNHKQIPLKTFKPDIVFYQQHVGICKENNIKRVMRYALTAYVPYNVPNYGNACYDYNVFCSQLYRFYTLNNAMKNYYIETINPSIANIVEVGHTALDYFYLNKGAKRQEHVIYAPHFSIMHPEVKNEFYYSTFNQNCDIILEFAKQHPEISWVFKPHPNLKESLKKMKIPNECIEAYYNEWKSIGKVCEDSDYQELFINSKAMITDCGSFLTEYFCTGNPLIHLVNPLSINWSCEAMRPMFETFYKVNNNNELIDVLQQIIINGDDYKKTLREKTSNKYVFANTYAAQNIKNDLDGLFN